MDTILEPQLAIPVIVVVVGAVLVYIFGFKQTEEPSYEHLAVLQSSSYKSRLSVPKKTTTSASNGVKPKNGHVNSVKKDKENKPPVAPIAKGLTKKSAKEDKPEDFESGEWIPAVSRKEKNKKVVKKVEEVVVVTPPKSPKKEIKEIKEIVPISPGKAPKIEDLLAEMKAGKTITAEIVEEKKDFKTNIAFDEMGSGDAWEEAKSRGAKKRRTRKD